MVTEKLLNSINKFLPVALISAAVSVLLYLLWYHYTLITFPWPIQYREGAILLTTDLLLKGGNPYNLALQPYYANTYGLIYNLIVLPFAMIWGPTLLVHKTVAGFFTLFSLALITFVLSRLKTPLKYLLPSLAILYAGLLFSKTSLAEPDSTGVFVFLLSVLIPLLMNFSVVSLGLSAFLVALAFCIKPYFVVGCAVVALYFLFTRSYRKFFIYGALTAGFLALALVLLNHYLEAYTINVLFANYNDAGKLHSKASKIWGQLGFVFYRDKFYLVTSLISITAISLFKPPTRSSEETFRLCMVGCIVQLVIFIVILGKNSGAFATYYYQLSMPFVAVLSALAFTAIRNRIALTFIQLSLVVAMVAIPGHFHSLRDEFGDNGLQWEKARELISTSHNVLSSPALAPLLIEKNLTVYDSGHTEAFDYGISNPGLIKDTLLPYTQLKKKMFFYTIADGISSEKFDLIMIDRKFSRWLLPLEPISKTYDYKGFLTLKMPHNHFLWQIDIWEPKGRK